MSDQPSLTDIRETALNNSSSSPDTQPEPREKTRREPRREPQPPRRGSLEAVEHGAKSTENVIDSVDRIFNRVENIVDKLSPFLQGENQGGGGRQPNQAEPEPPEDRSLGIEYDVSEPGSNDTETLQPAKSQQTTPKRGKKKYGDIVPQDGAEGTNAPDGKMETAQEERENYAAEKQAETIYQQHLIFFSKLAQENPKATPKSVLQSLKNERNEWITKIKAEIRRQSSQNDTDMETKEPQPPTKETTDPTETKTDNAPTAEAKS